MTAEEFKKASQELIDTCVEYNFMERTIHPYSFNMTVAELVKGWKDYDHCSRSSKNLMQDEYEGLAEIVQHWVEVENERTVAVIITDGKHKGEVRIYHESVAKDFVECGFAEYVDDSTTWWVSSYNEITGEQGGATIYGAETYEEMEHKYRVENPGWAIADYGRYSDM